MGTIFEEIGGEEAIMAAVDLFYDKVMDDVELAPFFEGMDMDAQNQKMVAFMAWAFGGPTEYKGRDLTEAHRGLVKNRGLNAHHFDLVATHLVATLNELGISQSLIDRVVELVSGTKSAVLGQ